MHLSASFSTLHSYFHRKCLRRHGTYTYLIPAHGLDGAWRVCFDLDEISSWRIQRDGIYAYATDGVGIHQATLHTAIIEAISTEPSLPSMVIIVSRNQLNARDALALKRLPGCSQILVRRSHGSY